MEMHVLYLNKRLPLFVALLAVMSVGVPTVADAIARVEIDAAGRQLVEQQVDRHHLGHR